MMRVPPTSHKSRHSHRGLHRLFLGLLWLGCLLMPFSTSKDSVVGVQSFGLPVLVVAALIGCLVATAQERRRLSTQTNFLIATAAVTVLWMMISSLWAPQLLASLSRALVNAVGFSLFVLCVLAFNPRREPAAWKRVVHPVVWMTTTLASYYILNLAFVIYEYGAESVVLERYVGGLMSLPWGASNTVASVLLMGLGATLLLRDSLPRAAVRGAVALHVLAIASTFSRNGTGMAVLLLFLGSSRSERHVLLAVLGTMAVAALGFNSLVSDSAAFAQLLDDRMTGGTEISNGRIDIWSEKIRYFMLHPMEPSGYYSSIYLFEFSGHNFAINTLIEQGVPGLAIALLFVWQLLIQRDHTVSQPKRQVPMTFVRIWLVMMLNMSFEDPNFVQPFIMVFWLMVAAQALASQAGPAATTRQRVLETRIGEPATT